MESVGNTLLVGFGFQLLDHFGKVSFLFDGGRESLEFSLINEVGPSLLGFLVNIVESSRN